MQTLWALRFMHAIAIAIATSLVAGCLGPDESQEGTDIVTQEVVGGTPTTARPDVGQLSVVCSGILIAPRYALTAGHCLEYSTTSLLRTSFAVIANNLAYDSEINRIHLFGAYGSSMFPGNKQPAGDGIGNNDVALVQLVDSNAATAATPATLATVPPLVGEPSTIVGWGCTNRSNPGEFSTKRSFSYTYGNSSQALCKGDSGGANVIGFGANTDAVWGVNSGTDSSGNDVFGSVSAYKEAIIEVIKNWNGTTLEVGIDRPGSDISIFVSSSAESCQAACKLSSVCRAFTYTSDDHVCYLKCAVPGWLPCPRCTSGIAQTIEPSTDRPGSDYAYMDLPERRPELCLAACARDPQCASYTYIDSIPGCALKSIEVAPVPNSCCSSGAPRGLEPNTERPGRDYRSVTLASTGTARTCANVCAKDSRCRAFTFWPPGTRPGTSSPFCQLKTAMAFPVPRSGVTSGARRGLEVNTDRAGSDYRFFETSTPAAEICQAACAAESACQAFTFVPPGVQSTKARCWLKSGIPIATKTEGMVSGLKGAEFF